MVIPEERDGKMEEDPNLARGATPANLTTNSRKGAVEKPVQKKVFVYNLEIKSSFLIWV